MTSSTYNNLAGLQGNLSTGEVLFLQLLKEGAHVSFVGPNAQGSQLLTALERLQTSPNAAALKIVPALTDMAAANMAVGFAQASSRPAVLVLNTGLGLANCLAAVYGASRIKTPLIILLEEPNSELINEDPPLSIHVLELAAPVTKWSCQVRSPLEITRLTRRAITEANAPAKGPVLISIPSDILAQKAQTKVVDPPHTSPLGAADHTFILKTARSLVSAQNPCLIAGNEVSQYRARKELATLAEVLGAPVYVESLPTGVNFANRHPQFGAVLPFDTDKSREILQGHDLILALGMQTRLPTGKDQAPLVNPRTAVIQINVDPLLAGRTMQSIASANADIAESLSRLRAEIQLIADAKWVNIAKQRAQDTIGAIQNRRQKAEESIDYPKESDPISVFWLLRILDGLRPQNSIILSDLTTESDPTSVLSLEGSSAFIGTNAGLEGYALAAAAGTQWASPDSMPIALTTDISFLQAPQSLWTISRLKMQVKSVIVNLQGKNDNLVQNAITQNMGRKQGWFGQSDSPNACELAQSMHVPAYKARTMGELNEGLMEMFAAQGPFLIDVEIGAK